MLVKYAIENIGDKGRGIIAQEDIPKGTLIWLDREEVTKIFHNPEEMKAYMAPLSAEEKKDILMYAFSLNDKVYLNLDDVHHMNHSLTPNCGELVADRFDLYALRDISKGEELCEDYGKYQALPWLHEILAEHDVLNDTQLLTLLKDPRYT